LSQKEKEEKRIQKGLIKPVQESIVEQSRICKDMRKLSEIIIEIAKTGFKDEKYFESDLMHTCMFLAYVAWNRDTRDLDYQREIELTETLKKFPHNKRRVRRELISENWEDI